MDVAIFENDKRTGSVHLDDRSFEYDGNSQRIYEVLRRMERGEITMTRPVMPNDEPDADDDTPSFETKPGPEDANHREGVESTAITGKMLGRHLRKALTSESHGEGVRVEAVEGNLDAERIDLDDDNTGSEDNDGESSFSEESFEASYGPPTKREDNE